MDNYCFHSSIVKLLSNSILCYRFYLESCTGNKCYIGEVVYKGNYLQSENHRYKLIFRKSGNLEMFCGKVLIWASNTFDNTISGLYFDDCSGITLIGNLIHRKKILHVPYGSNQRKTYLLVLQNDGNLIFYSHSKDWTCLTGMEASLGTDGKCSKSKNSFVIISANTEAISQKCSTKNAFLQISQNSQENTCARVSFLKTQLFSCDFCEILKIAFFEKHLRWLFLVNSNKNDNSHWQVLWKSS